MEINIKSLKFDADQKLIAFVEKKLSRFYENLDSVDVVLSLLHEPENKNVKVQTHVLGQDLVIERNAQTFEEAVNDAADAMKEKITRAKEKKYEA